MIFTMHEPFAKIIDIPVWYKGYDLVIENVTGRYPINDGMFSSYPSKRNYHVVNPGLNTYTSRDYHYNESINVETKWVLKYLEPSIDWWLNIGKTDEISLNRELEFRCFSNQYGKDICFEHYWFQYLCDIVDFHLYRKCLYKCVKNSSS